MRREDVAWDYPAKYRLQRCGVLRLAALFGQKCFDMHQLPKK